MENHAFDNYNTFDPDVFDPTLDTYDATSAESSLSMYDDEEDGYDLPSNYSRSPKKTKMKQQPLAQLDIVIDNSTQTSTDVTIELFNYLRSNTLIRNTNYNGTTYEPQTLDKTTGYIASTALTGFSGTSPAISGPSANYAVPNTFAYRIYWDSDGNLIYSANQGISLYTKISCPQVPFRVLHEATRNNLLYIEKFRLSTKSTAQIDQPFNVFKNTFLGGTKSNQIAPRSEFKPNQYQTNIVDVPMKIGIDAETGLSYKVKAQELMTISMFFRFMRGNEFASASMF
jgi:hypothetical protein